MTWQEWYKLHWKECKSGTFDVHTTYEMIWNAAREDLLKEMYPLRGISHNTSNSNKEQTNENR